MVRLRAAIALVSVVALAATFQPAGASSGKAARFERRSEIALPEGYEPAVVAQSRLARYFVVLKAPALAERLGERALKGRAQRSAIASVRRSQSEAVADARRRGGRVVFRYSRLVNAFSARLSPDAARALSARSDVAFVQPVAIVERHNSTSVPFIGAPRVWKRFGARGKGVRVAVVDTGIDYTHAALGGRGTVAAYQSNDPRVREPGTFPTNKVIGGFDFVGENYDVLDDNPDNDVPVPDPDPLDFDGHGTHVAGTCCGRGVPGVVGKGVAPAVKLFAYRVWDVGNSTEDVLVAAYERAVDPNEDGSVRDRVDVLQFSGGVDYGTANSVEALAAQRVVDLGTVMVAAAGNAGNQPVGGQPYIAGTPATASGVISVAASIDQFVARTITVNEPADLELPGGGIMVHQDWSGPLEEALTGEVVDARGVDPPADPDGIPAPEDAPLCEGVPPGGPFEGKIALVFKGSTGGGDCDGSLKVFNAQEAGAIAVILWSGFGGLPFGLGAGEAVDQITIPAVMVSGDDGAALAAAASPEAPSAYNTATVNVTLNEESSVIPGFEDFMTDFTSEGPARVTNELKPDISAPGADITSASAGSGDGSAILSGTSMAAPHVSGVAALIKQLHPRWSPAKVKGVLMNNATRSVADNNGVRPVSATVIGAGRVRAFKSAKSRTVAWPGSLSFGLRHLTGTTTLPARVFKIQNTSNRARTYDLFGTVRYSDFDPTIVRLPSGGGFLPGVLISLDGRSYGDLLAFRLGPGQTKKVWVRLALDPSVITPAGQLSGWYFFHPNVDGLIEISARRGKERIAIPWHVAPLAASNDQARKTSLNLEDGSDTFGISHEGAGQFQADLYHLGALDAVENFGEEDITHVGVRSFAGDTIGNASADSVPTGTDPIGELPWLGFLTSVDEPTEPIEFGIRTQSIHNTTATLEVNVMIDAGADGVFADEELQADYLLSKLPGGGDVCLFDLSRSDPFAECARSYFPDYSNFNTNVIGLVADASAIGLSESSSRFSYSVSVCTGRFSGDVPQQFCDTAVDFDDEAGTWSAVFDAGNLPLIVDPLICGGFWGGEDCTGTADITVSSGAVPPAEAPDLLVLFPNNPPESTAQVVTIEP